MPMMRGKVLQGIGIFWTAAILAACASSADQRESADSGPPPPPFSQIKAAPESFKGQTLVLSREPDRLQVFRELEQFLTTHLD